MGSTRDSHITFMHIANPRMLKWIENHEVSGSNPNKDILGDFFPSILSLVGRVHRDVKLVKVRVSWK